MANITRFDPFNDLDNLFNGLFVRPMRLDVDLPAQLQLRVDVTRTDDTYSGKAELPGVRKEDIEIAIEGNEVTIGGEIKKESEQKKGEEVIRSERYYGKVSRSFTLPHDIDGAKVVAKYADGVLTLTLPKVETMPSAPLSPYALQKLVGEQYCQLFTRLYGLETVTIRYFNVFGPRQDPNGAYAAVIPKWIVRMIRNEPVQIYGDGGTTRDFCYVENAVQANLLAAMAADRAAVNQVYNIAVNESISLNELFEAIRSLLEPRIPRLRGFRPIHREFRAGDVLHSLGGIDRAARLLGYSPAWKVRQGLERTIHWYLGQSSLRILARGVSRSRPRPMDHGSIVPQRVPQT